MYSSNFICKYKLKNKKILKKLLTYFFIYDNICLVHVYLKKTKNGFR